MDPVLLFSLVAAALVIQTGCFFIVWAGMLADKGWGMALFALCLCNIYVYIYGWSGWANQHKNLVMLTWTICWLGVFVVAKFFGS